jgi:type VI protein secretion system component VasF|tara:strand:+ start:794 stop:967 length:174 start_codon:yes stop_codon:yes gene_type:complete
MFNFEFNSLAEAFLMQSQNGQNHGIFVWTVLIIVFLSILATFIFYKMSIKKITKKLK